MARLGSMVPRHTNAPCAPETLAEGTVAGRRRRRRQGKVQILIAGNFEAMILIHWNRRLGMPYHNGISAGSRLTLSMGIRMDFRIGIFERPPTPPPPGRTLHSANNSQIVFPFTFGSLGLSDFEIPMDKHSHSDSHTAVCVRVCARV